MLVSGKFTRYLALAIAGLCIPAIVLSATSSGAPTLSSLGWKEKAFSGNTRYSLEDYGTALAIKGVAAGTASALYKDANVNLKETPFLSWEWKINNVFDNVKEKKKSGDDFPARLYVVYQRGIFKWSTVAINYVWSSQYPVGESWNSAYTSKSKIIVLQSGDSEAGSWVAEKRNIAEDFQTLFNIDVSKLDGYAVMVDGDNTGSTGTSWFSKIVFNEQ